jgi:hypothetical protein
MTDFDERTSLDAYDQAAREMLALATRLKRDFGLEETIDRVLRRNDVALTPGAMMVLVAPLVEAAGVQKYRHERQGIYDDGLDVDMTTVARSVEAITEEAKSDPAKIDRIPRELRVRDPAGDREVALRSSQSILKAIARRFCRIPPFCAE